IPLHGPECPVVPIPAWTRPIHPTVRRYAKLRPTRRRCSGRGEPLLNNETLERLRLPAAWVLIGAVGASMLSGLIGLIACTIGSPSGTGAPPGLDFPSALSASGGASP